MRPEQAEPTQASKITTIAAVAACEAVELVSNRRAQIKWVNDIYLDDRKISGILTEASVSMETGSVEYVILGIGMNIYVPEEGFPEEIREYRRRSLVVGREIIIFSPKGERKAVATGVDEDCHLLVQYEDGSTDRLSSGRHSPHHVGCKTFFPPDRHKLLLL